MEAILNILTLGVYDVLKMHMRRAEIQTDIEELRAQRRQLNELRKALKKDH